MKNNYLLQFILLHGIFTVLSLIFPGNLLAQKQGQSYIDSILITLSKAKEDSNKVKLFNELSFEFESINQNEGLKYGNLAMSLGKKLKLNSSVAAALYNIAINYCSKGDYPNSLHYHFLSLKLFEELKDDDGIANNLNRIGLVYFYQNDYKNALDYYTKSKTIFEKTESDGIHLVLGNIATLYYAMGETDKSLDYMQKALKQIEKLPNSASSVAIILSNIGSILTSQKKYKEALDYLKQSLVLAKKLGNRSTSALSYINMGELYLAMAKDTKKGIYFSGLNKNKVLQLAVQYTDSAIEIDEDKQNRNLDNLNLEYKNLSEIQELKGDYKSALKSYILHTAFKDSVYNLENEKKLSQTAMQYEFDKKESIAKSEQERKNIVQKNIRNSIIAGALILLVLLLLLYNRYAYKNKTNKQLQEAYDSLKSTQEQLVKSEKLAAFGTIATRMAHEIQNPLNFVNNFSEVSKELVHEVITTDSEEEKNETANLLIDNLDKISHHGKRASNIIKQLQELSNKGIANEFFEH